MTRPRPSRDEADLRRIAAVTCPQDRGEDPFAWSDLPPTTHQEPTVTTTAPTPADAHEDEPSEPTTPLPLTERELAYALDNATPYPVDLAPELAAAMAARLAGMVTAYRRPEHPV
ncbi:hypothetical protein ACPCK3_15050, partial [Streptomyces griseoincarnatus]